MLSTTRMTPDNVPALMGKNYRKATKIRAALVARLWTPAKLADDARLVSWALEVLSIELDSKWWVQNEVLTGFESFQFVLRAIREKHPQRVESLMNDFDMQEA